MTRGPAGRGSLQPKESKNSRSFPREKPRPGKGTGGILHEREKEDPVRNSALYGT